MIANAMSAHDLFRLWLEGGRAFAEGGQGGGDHDGEHHAASNWRNAESMFSAWSSFVEAFAAEHAARRSGPGASPFDPAGWLRAPGDGGMADFWRWLEGPDFADLFAEERRLLAESREWSAWLAALDQFRSVLGAGWIAAFRAFAERVLAEGDAARARGEPPQGWEQLLGLWREIADGEMARTQRSEAYLVAQRQLLEAQLALRARLRARIERYSELLGIPTRREVDDLHAAVHALRRELRALRRDRDPG